jgi:hypothetical protein
MFLGDVVVPVGVVGGSSVELARAAVCKETIEEITEARMLIKVIATRKGSSISMSITVIFAVVPSCDRRNVITRVDKRVLRKYLFDVRNEFTIGRVRVIHDSIAVIVDDVGLVTGLLLPLGLLTGRTTAVIGTTATAISTTTTT